MADLSNAIVQWAQLLLKRHAQEFSAQLSPAWEKTEREAFLAKIELPPVLIHFYGSDGKPLKHFEIKNDKAPA